MNTYKYRISTKLKDEIKDPSGEVAQTIAQRLNICSDLKIKTGKFYEVTIKANDKMQADDKIKTLCVEIFTNPLVENYSIEGFEIIK